MTKRICQQQQLMVRTIIAERANSRVVMKEEGVCLKLLMNFLIRIRISLAMKPLQIRSIYHI